MYRMFGCVFVVEWYFKLELKSRSEKGI